MIRERATVIQTLRYDAGLLVTGLNRQLPPLRGFSMQLARWTARSSGHPSASEVYGNDRCLGPEQKRPRTLSSELNAHARCTLPQSARGTLLRVFSCHRPVVPRCAASTPCRALSISCYWHPSSLWFDATSLRGLAYPFKHAYTFTQEPRTHIHHQACRGAAGTSVPTAASCELPDPRELERGKA